MELAPSFHAAKLLTSALSNMSYPSGHHHYHSGSDQDQYAYGQTPQGTPPFSPEVYPQQHPEQESYYPSGLVSSSPEGYYPGYPQYPGQHAQQAYDQTAYPESFNTNYPPSHPYASSVQPSSVGYSTSSSSSSAHEPAGMTYYPGPNYQYQIEGQVDHRSAPYPRPQYSSPNPYPGRPHSRSVPVLPEARLTDFTRPRNNSSGSLHYGYSSGSGNDPDSPLLTFSPGDYTGAATSTTRPSNQPLYTHQDQLQFFRDAVLNCPMVSEAGPFIPQPMYKPHTTSDRRRYVEEVDLDAPIYFWVNNPTECGLPLIDALHSRVKRLQNRDECVFEGRGPSVSIRLEWPGYRQWSRQIPTKDFRSPPGPITRAKLAKNVAKCVQRFIAERMNHSDADADPRWRIGTGPEHIKLEDLILVSMHHVSMGSWQPQLRLRHPLADSTAPAVTPAQGGTTSGSVSA